MECIPKFLKIYYGSPTRTKSQNSGTYDCTQDPPQLQDYKPFHVRVDANDSTVAGSQINDQNVECPLAFFSVKLNGTQKVWATVHKEAYAVIAALKKFRNWELRSTRILITIPLLFLQSLHRKMRS